MWGAILGGIASAAASYIGNRKLAQSQADYNADQAYSTNMFNAEQAAINRDFQREASGQQMWFNAAQADITRQWDEKMSNTAFQRAVGDMTSAGLNPMMTVSQGGASSPSGPAASAGMPSGSSASGVHATKSLQDFGSVLASASMLVDVENKYKQGKILEEQAAAIEQGRLKDKASTWKTQTDEVKTQEEIKQIKSSIENINADTLNKEQQRALMRAQEQLIQVQTDLDEHKITNVQADTRVKQAVEMLHQLDIKIQLPMAEKADSLLGGAAPWLKDILTIIQILQGGKGVMR